MDRADTFLIHGSNGDILVNSSTGAIISILREDDVEDDTAYTNILKFDIVQIKADHPDYMSGMDILDCGFWYKEYEYPVKGWRS